MAGILCEHCTAVCCRYIALPIDTPETDVDFEGVRWFLIHEHVSVFVEDGAWYIAFETMCRHLQADHRCGIYATRPRVCRAYSTDDCDYHSGDYGWELHLTSAEHLDLYLRHRRQRARATSSRAATQRTRLKVRSRRRPAGERLVDHAAPTDRRGVALPVLPFRG